MDLGTVKDNIEKGDVYEHFEDAFADLQLIWSNCKLYNQSGSDIYRLAENLERRCKKLIKELRSSLNLEIHQASAHLQASAAVGELIDAGGAVASAGGKTEGDGEDDEDDDFGYDPHRYVPFEDKAEFADGIKKITKEGLTQIVNYLKEKQPDALDDFGNDKLQIRIDLIEREAFNHCKELLALNIKETVPNKRQKVVANQSAPLK
ncbi:hypothetical protein FGO68_gene5251 [Halteria grandinella]|uniref:Bromo domain-containing protein n=1 Tax=Halteria grandinella TaxID=5974 RepID=A0A8J8T4E9_HALGN|nr:hypothetical protein FGO68_gene5251 [Halteria grandinella]